MKLTRFKLLTLSFTVLGALCVTAHASAGSLVLTIPKSKPRKIHTQHLLRASTLEKVPLNPAYSRSVADALSQNSTLIALPSGGRGSVENISFPGARSSNTLVVWNGIILNNPASPGGSADVSLLNSENIENIQIIPTSDPRLGGGGSGVITLDSDSANQFSSVKLEGGSFGYGNFKLQSVSRFEDGDLNIAFQGMRTDGTPNHAHLPLESERQKLENTAIKIHGHIDYSKIKFSVLGREGRQRTNLSTPGFYQESQMHTAAVSGLYINDDQLHEQKFTAMHNSIVRQNWGIDGYKTAMHRGTRHEIKHTGIFHLETGDLEVGGGLVEEGVTTFTLKKSRLFGYASIMKTIDITPAWSVKIGTQISTGLSPFKISNLYSALEYKKHKTNLSLSFDQSVQRPTLFNLYVNNPYAQGNPNLKPETISGVRGTWSEKTILPNLDFSVSLFLRQYDQAVTWHNRTYFNAPPYFVLGIEPEARITLMPDLFFSESFMYMGIKKTKKDLNSPIPFLRWKSSAKLSYEKTVEEGMDLVYLRLRSQDAQHENNKRYEGGHFVDMGGTYKIKSHLHIYLRFENVFNKAPEVRENVSAPPREFVIGLTCQF